MYNLQLRWRSSSELRKVVFVNKISSTFANIIEFVLGPKSLNMLE
jgi:hypothetical protein